MIEVGGKDLKTREPVERALLGRTRANMDDRSTMVCFDLEEQSERVDSRLFDTDDHLWQTEYTLYDPQVG